MPAPVIQFRLAHRHHRLLVKQADGENVNTFARELLIRALAEDALATRLEEFLSKTSQDVGEVRKDISVVAQTLLVAMGKLTVEQARDWAQSRLANG